ncbi:haloacid dehalogenase [Candidatus Methylomirabilis limnetica]|uniref:Haloacid dehalogenase n=1 Tax=Candidatus Methylomirabilis limnetica TaxID=2033718 RepID=A0A2T4TXP4_9BACT|nr:HAD family hydrolase [Candidatus Methylomirabilis limnetica]PTL35847.1 haloacid dehalogenase [Candidatus Methylomirabilis limnetica]
MPLEIHNAAEAGGTSEYHLMTVDVWDTLLRRRCHPDAVKLHVCRWLLHCHGRRLPPEHRDHWVLLRLRQQAERELGEESRREGGDDEYRHLEVYERWLYLAGIKTTFSPEEISRLCIALGQVELEQERYISYADPSIADVLADIRARKTLFLSDFYLPVEMVRELLSFHHMDGIAPDGVVSCDVKLNKKSGRLFRYLHESLGITPDRHIHVGDHLWADVESPKQIGIAVAHYMPENEHRQRRMREDSFRARGDFLQRAVHLLCDSRDSRYDQDGSLSARFYELGRESSLWFFGFVLYLMECAVAEKVDRLFFLTREGEFFLELYRRAAECRILGCSVPEGTLLEVSRISTFAGSLRSFTSTELMRIWNQYSVQSMNALLTSLGIDPSRFVDKAASYGIDIDQDITYPWQDSRVQAWFNDDWVRQEIERELSRKQSDLSSYLASVGLPGQSTKVGIVDIGWRGTIQDNLAYAMPTVQLHGYYLGLIRYLNDQPSNAVKSAFGPNLNEAQSDYADLLDFVAPVEMLCNSPHGGVERYEVSGNGVRVARLTDPAENQVYDSYIRHFQAGVIDSIAYWSDFVRTHAYTSAEIRPLAMEIWGTLIQKPPSFLSKAYFELNHNETFGVGRFSDKRRSPRTQGLLFAFLSKRHRQQLDSFLTEVGWVPGLMVHPETAPIFKWFLRTFLQARRIKRFACNFLRARFV